MLTTRSPLNTPAGTLDTFDWNCHTSTLHLSCMRQSQHSEKLVIGILQSPSEAVALQQSHAVRPKKCDCAIQLRNELYVSKSTSHPRTMMCVCVLLTIGTFFCCSICLGQSPSDCSSCSHEKEQPSKNPTISPDHKSAPRKRAQ